MSMRNMLKVMCGDNEVFLAEHKHKHLSEMLAKQQAENASEETMKPVRDALASLETAMELSQGLAERVNGSKMTDIGSGRFVNEGLETPVDVNEIKAQTEARKEIGNEIMALMQLFSQLMQGMSNRSQSGIDNDGIDSDSENNIDSDNDSDLSSTYDSPIATRRFGF